MVSLVGLASRLKKIAIDFRSDKMNLDSMRCLTLRVNRMSYTASALIIRFWAVLKAIMQLFLLMVKQVLERLIPWEQAAQLALV